MGGERVFLISDSVETSTPPQLGGENYHHLIVVICRRPVKGEGLGTKHWCGCRVGCG